MDLSKERYIEEVVGGREKREQREPKDNDYSLQYLPILLVLVVSSIAAELPYILIFKLS